MNSIKSGLRVFESFLTMSLIGCSLPGGVPSVVIREAPAIELPGVCIPERNIVGDTDCNNPVHWDQDTMYVFSSTGHPYRGSGPDLFHLARPSQRITYDNEQGFKGGGRWIEATYKADDGALYGWYHNEPPNICGQSRLTAPRIGALVSHDNGLYWRDLGIIMEAPPHSLQCATANQYFAGGNGDFSVILDRKKEYFYFFISTYHKDVAEQGVSVARMRCQDRDNPVGKVFKWHKDQWSEPGIGGQVTPIIPVTTDWNRKDANAFWGPAIHWNTYLKQYVMLLNRAKDWRWAQEGVYVTFNRSLADPHKWTMPTKILDAAAWYPQVIGTDKAKRETDKEAGQVARLFVRGRSKCEIVFELQR